jgi:hypothetical protein
MDRRLPEFAIVKAHQVITEQKAKIAAKLDALRAEVSNLESLV